MTARREFTKTVSIGFVGVLYLGAAASLFRNQELKWDNNAMKITNLEQANSVINPQFRSGWNVGRPVF